MTTTGQDWALQVAIVALLKANSELQGLLGSGSNMRIYQDVPDNPTYPYLVMGEGTVNDDSVVDLAAEEIYPDIHIWTSNATSPGWSDAKRIEAIIKGLLHDAEPALTGNRCVLLQFDSARNGGAESPALKHRVVTFRALTEPAA